MKMTQDDRTDPPLAELLDELKPVPGRGTQTAARARARFLAQAVSMRRARRHRVWTIFPRKGAFSIDPVFPPPHPLGPAVWRPPRRLCRAGRPAQRAVVSSQT